MIQTLRAAAATAERNEHGEGPSWDARSGQLVWVDQYAGRVQVGDFDRSSATLQVVADYDVGAPVGAVVPTTEADGWLLAFDQGFGRLSRDGSLQRLAQPEAGAPTRMRMNDGKCAPDGSFWAGSMAWDKRPGAGTLYRLGPDLQLSTVLSGVSISNGLAWSADQARLYYIDTPTQRVDRFRYHSAGELAERETVVAIAEQDGHPDGMAIDEQGCLWVALWDGWSVRRYAPNGELLAVVEVDAPQVSSCCFGGPDGTTLFITTSQEDMSAADRNRFPRSGKVFSAEVGVRGEPAAAFGPRP